LCVVVTSTLCSQAYSPQLQQLVCEHTVSTVDEAELFTADYSAVIADFEQSAIEKSHK